MWFTFRKLETMNIVDKTLYTKTEYCKAFNISRPTLDKRIREKEVKIVKVHGAILIKV